VKTITQSLNYSIPLILPFLNPRALGAAHAFTFDYRVLRTAQSIDVFANFFNRVANVVCVAPAYLQSLAKGASLSS
jgi:hypothetical protein